MALGQIHYMDVVPNTRAVRGRVVVAEDIETLAAAHGHLANVWHEVVGAPLGILADQTAFMGADRVEISQKGDPPIRIGDINVLKNLFDHELGVAIRISWR